MVLTVVALALLAVLDPAELAHVALLAASHVREHAVSKDVDDGRAARALAPVHVAAVEADRDTKRFSQPAAASGGRWRGGGVAGLDLPDISRTPF